MPKIRISSRLRDMVAERAFYCCEYCWSQADFSTESFSVEHIIPLSRGGENTHDNVAVAATVINMPKLKRWILWKMSQCRYLTHVSKFGANTFNGILIIR